MNFPTRTFGVIKTKNIIPKFFPKYGSNSWYQPIIRDNEGERWLCHFKKGFKLEPHNHKGRYEWYVLSGKFLFMNPETKESVILEKGDYYCNPPEVPHCEECLEDGEVLWIYNMKEEHD